MVRELDVFRKNSGFIKLFQSMKEKYRSYGRFGGTVSLQGFSVQELEGIAGFLGQSPDKLMQKGKLAIAVFEKELAKTNFSHYALAELIEAVLGEELATKKEMLSKEQEEEALFLQSLLQVMPDAQWWIDRIRMKSPDTRWMWSLYKQNPTQLFDNMIIVYQAFAVLPSRGEFERLPFFAQRVTGNPHYFDSGETAGKLLLHCLYVHQVMHGNNELTMPKTAEERNDLLAEYGLLRDDLWNFVTLQGMLAATQEGVHAVWQTAVDSHSVLNVPMKELIKIQRIWPAQGRVVWVVENSGVASELMEKLPDAPIVCTHGQLRVASWTVLRLLVEAGTRLYYSGDLDPEGILIAERLRNRLGEQVVFWRMDAASYLASLSSEDMTERLVKLQRLDSEQWDDVLGLMREKKVAGYQEALIDLLVEDIRKVYE